MLQSCVTQLCGTVVRVCTPLAVRCEAVIGADSGV